MIPGFVAGDFLIAIAFAPNGPFGEDLYAYVALGGQGSVFRINSLGQASEFARGFGLAGFGGASISAPAFGLTFSSDGGSLFISDIGQKRIFRVAIASDGSCVPTPGFRGFVPGDVNSDECFDIADSVVLRRDLAGLGPGITQQCRLLGTGQSTCWDSSGFAIPCAGTGQDGELQAGAPLGYVDNGDGTITDLATGLMWEKKSDDGSIHDQDANHTWDNAFAVHVAGLNAAAFAGHTDWRLPNRNELQSILDLETFTPAVDPVFNSGCVPTCTVTTCSCTVSSVYWSSTSNAFFPTDAWGVLFVDGFVVDSGKSDNFFVRAVRGGL